MSLYSDSREDSISVFQKIAFRHTLNKDFGRIRNGRMFKLHNVWNKRWNQILSSS